VDDSMKTRNILQIITLVGLAAGSVYPMQAADPTKNIRFEKKSNDYSSYIEAIDNKNNEFIGNISYSVSLCSIDYVWVIEKMRNKGIGSQLFKQARNGYEQL
jgi:hypothetical protein